MKVGDYFSCREIVKSSVLPLEIFPSNYIHLRSVILQRRQKAEVNGFAAYRGKAHLKDNIREGMVGHQIVVLSFKTRLLDMQLLTSFCSKNGTLQKST